MIQAHEHFHFPSLTMVALTIKGNGYIVGGGEDGDDDDVTWQAWIWRSRGGGDEGMLDGFRKSLQPQNNRMMDGWGI